MSIHKDFEDMLRCLNDAKVRYLIVGAHAVSFYTEPRYTKDIDFLIEPTVENAPKVLEALKKFGAPVAGLKISDFINPNLVYQIGVAPVRIDIIMGIKGVDFRQAWVNKKATRFGRERIFVLGIDDLIRAKEASARTQDELDLEKLKKAKKFRKKK